MGYKPMEVERIEVRDVRFPTSKDLHGSDAMHSDPDYSCAYVIIHLIDSNLKGHGLTFTLGRGTEIVVQAIRSLAHLVIGQSCYEIWDNFGRFWRRLTSESQIRWVGPEKGVTHLAVAAIINGLWDLWAKYEKKPLWKLLVDLSPEQLVSTIDFRYITDVISAQECIDLIREPGTDSSIQREHEMKTEGYPAYTTQVGWLRYSNETLEELCQQFIQQGFDAFKIKVGKNLEDDKRRCQIVRDAIGPHRKLMLDANQKWDVDEAIKWVIQLKHFSPMWIEEPTSPDDILGHAEIKQALSPYGIGVATGEMAQNRVIFKQLFQKDAISYCQIDSCRLGGVNEILAVYFMAHKFGIPVCPHAGGVGLCELVQHLQIWDYIALSSSKHKRMIEWVDHLHEHFKYPPIIKNAAYLAPTEPGYSSEMKEDSLNQYEFPNGTYWRNV